MFRSPEAANFADISKNIVILTNHKKSIGVARTTKYVSECKFYLSTPVHQKFQIFV